MDNNVLFWLLIGLAVLSVALLVLLIIAVVKLSERNDTELQEAIESDLSRQRNEINQRLDSMSSSINGSLRDGLSDMLKTETDNMKAVNTGINERLTVFEKTISDGNAKLDARMEEMRKSQEERLETVRSTTEKQLSDIRESNQKKLDEIENTVAEKLDKTLAERVSESFKRVSEQLESVYKSLGEMNNLASDVGSLKKALTNVKVRGEIGEIQLGRILEQTLTKDQYDENVRTKKNSDDPVEFAVKIPAKDEDNKYIYLPIDAKFPLDTYSALVDAYTDGDKTLIDSARSALNETIKKEAKTISSKYIDVPATTDFAIMFLPTEGLFAEVIRNVELTEKLRNDFSITVCGPSTITAFLNSLQMGFRTLAIEKRSGQVWRTLGEVKTEFGKFSTSLTKIKENIDRSGRDLDSLLTTRTNAIQRKLRDVEALPYNESDETSAVENGD